VVNTAGTITGLVVDANGCMRQLDTVQIMVNPLPNDSIYASGPTTFCDGDSVVISSADGTSAYLWNTASTNQSVSATASGPYYLGLLTNKGCVALSDTIDVVVNPNPNANVTITGSLDLCPGDSVGLSANSGLSYAWSTGDSTQSITVGQSANITVDVTNGFGCTSTSAVQEVVLHAFPATLQIFGDTVGIIPLQQYIYAVSQNLGNSYQWTAVNGAVISGQGTNIATVVWSQDTTGSLTLVESNGHCNDTTSIQIRTNIGIEDMAKSNIKLFPNPTQGRLVIQSDHALGDYAVYDVTGSIVVSGSSLESEIHLDLTELPSGVYWVSVYNRQYKMVIID